MIIANAVMSAGTDSTSQATVFSDIAAAAAAYSDHLRAGHNDLQHAAQRRLLVAIAAAHRTTLASSPHEGAAYPGATDQEARDLRRDPEDIAIYDDYFGLTRVAGLSLGEQAIEALPTFSRFVRGLTSARMFTADHAAATIDLLTAMARSIAGSGAAPSTLSLWARAEALPWIGMTEAAAPASPRDVVAPLSPLGQWKLGHQLYGLANRRAANALDSATATLTERELAVAHLESAADAIAGITATMLFAAAITSAQYTTAVRPTMGPPHCPTELTGGMNLDHARYRRSLNNFLAVCDEPYRHLALHSTALADARERVLHLDLIDLTEHVALTHRLVGSAPALDERDDGSAVQQLRGLLSHRTQTYSAMMRLGARVALQPHAITAERKTS